jgi:hypothetical protein
VVEVDWVDWVVEVWVAVIGVDVAEFVRAVALFDVCVILVTVVS